MTVKSYCTSFWEFKEKKLVNILIILKMYKSKADWARILRCTLYSTQYQTTINVPAMSSSFSSSGECKVPTYRVSYNS